MSTDSLDATLNGTPRGPSRPTLLLAALFAFAIPFDPLPLLAGRTPGLPLGLLLVISVALDRLAGRRAGKVPSPVAGILPVYLAWILFSTYWSLAPNESLLATLQMFVRGAFLVALCFVVPSHWKQLTTAYALGAGALATLLITSGDEEYLGRVTYMGADENAVALSLAVGFSLCLAKASERKPSGIAFFLVLALYVAYAAVATGSRTGIIALALAVGVRLFDGRRSHRVVRALFSLGVLGIAAVYMWRKGLVSPRITDFIEGGSLQDESRSWILHAFFEHPDWMLSGTGFQADATYLQRVAGSYSFVHNLYVGTWVQLGIVGVALLLSLLASIVHAGWGSERRWMWTSAFVSMFAFTMTLGGQTSNVYWFVIALAVARSSQSIALYEAPDRGHLGASQFRAHGKPARVRRKGPKRYVQSVVRRVPVLVVVDLVRHPPG